MAPPLRICVDAAILASGAVGITSYALGLVAALAARDDADLVVVGPDPAQFEGAGPHDFHQLPAGVRGATSRLRWRERELPAIVERSGADVLLAANPELPYRRLAVPSIVVVHDVFPLAKPSLTGRAQRVRFKLLFPRVCARATAIACVSEATRAAVQRVVDVSPRKLHVVGEGPSRLPAVDAPEAPGGRPYLLYVGELFERKNVVTLLAAFAEAGDLDLDLVMAGPAENDAVERLLRASGAARLGDRAKHLGFVGDDELARLYAGALGLVLPSLEEGFGRPLLDAMATGTPAIASDIPALRELAGSAAYLVTDPHDQSAWREALRTFVADADLRRDLAARGRERARDFDWAAIAARMLRLARQVVGDAPQRAPA